MFLHFYKYNNSVSISIDLKTIAIMYLLLYYNGNRAASVVAYLQIL